VSTTRKNGTSVDLVKNSFYFVFSSLFKSFHVDLSTHNEISSYGTHVSIKGFLLDSFFRTRTRDDMNESLTMCVL